MVLNKQRVPIEAQLADDFIDDSLENPEDDLIDEKAAIIYEHEMLIDMSKPVIGITWSPDPKDLPDCEFDLQHRYYVPYLVQFIRSCKLALLCVESSKLGRPHYHGWYQEDPDPILYKMHIVHMKVLGKTGQLKVTELKHLKPGTFYKKPSGNALWYYKKDVFEKMLVTPCNPIHKDLSDDYDWVGSTFFTCEMSSNMKLIADKVSETKMLREFYRCSDDSVFEEKEKNLRK